MSGGEDLNKKKPIGSSDAISFAPPADYGFTLTSYKHRLPITMADAEVLIIESLTHTSRYEEGDQILEAQPSFKTAVLRFALDMARIVPDKDGNILLDTCLKTAIDRYIEVRNSSSANEMSAHRKAFVLGFVKNVPQIHQNCIQGFFHKEGVWRVWDRLNVPFTQWALNDDISQLHVAPFDDLDESKSVISRMHAINRYFDYSDLVALNVRESDLLTD